MLKAFAQPCGKELYFPKGNGNLTLTKYQIQPTVTAQYLFQTQWSLNLICINVHGFAFAPVGRCDCYCFGIFTKRVGNLNCLMYCKEQNIS